MVWGNETARERNEAKTKRWYQGLLNCMGKRNGTGEKRSGNGAVLWRACEIAWGNEAKRERNGAETKQSYEGLGKWCGKRSRTGKERKEARGSGFMKGLFYSSFYEGPRNEAERSKKRSSTKRALSSPSRAPLQRVMMFYNLIYNALTKETDLREPGSRKRRARGRTVNWTNGQTDGRTDGHNKRFWTILEGMCGSAWKTKQNGEVCAMIGHIVGENEAERKRNGAKRSSSTNTLLAAHSFCMVDS